MWKMPYYARRFENPGALALAALIAVFFLVDFFTHESLVALLAWEPSVAWIKSGAFWQPFTFPLVPFSIWTVLFDCMMLVFVGGSLERAWGTGKFLFFFFSSGIIAGLVLIPQTLTVASTPFFTGMVGSIPALAVAFGAMNPYATIILYFFPIQARWFAAIIVAFELFANYPNYGGQIQAVVSIGVVSIYAYLFTTRRPALPNIGSGAADSWKERFDRWQQRRRMRSWQRRVSKIDRPEDLFKDK
jgi:membrane associated rhomboid family serine protease